MFDHKPDDNHDKKESINLLPIELQKDTPHDEKKHFTPGTFHVPAKEVAHKNSVASLPQPANRQSALPRRSFFGRLFGKKSKKTKEASIVAVNIVAPPSNTITPPPPSPRPTTPPPPPRPVAPVKPPIKKEMTGFNEAKIDNDRGIGKNLEVNLLPVTPKGFTNSQIIWSYFFIFIISALIIFSPYIFFKSKNSRYTQDIALLQEKLLLVDKKTSELEAAVKSYGALAQQFNNLTGIFDNHIYWSQFFPTLENHTAGKVFFSGLTVTEFGEIKLKGSALDLRSLAEELVVLSSSPVYRDVSLQTLSFLEPKNPGDPTVSFDLNFVLPASVIENPNKSTTSKTSTK